ncbi:MAG: hypothetical protein ACYDHW_03130 [Syntrophorhabdaceae bacterium]
MQTYSWRKLYVFIGVFFIAALVFNPLSAEGARKKPLHTGKDVKGIPFEEFWGKIREDGSKWAGNRLRIRKIISVPVVGFDGRAGRSPVWEAQLVRCDRSHVFDEDEKAPGKTCRGKTITLRMSEAGVIGGSPGVQTSKEIHFRGFSVPVERIKVTPQAAEDMANSYRRYNPTEIDTYGYELRYDQRRDTPVWVIKRTCGYKGKAEGRCQQGDYWIVKVDAEAGAIVKPGNKPPRALQPVDGNDD